jgi:hypothetical protein
MNTGITLGGWLGNFLIRLAEGATPIDGVHQATRRAADNVPSQAARSRHFAASYERGVTADQKQFIRGLS